MSKTATVCFPAHVVLLDRLHRACVDATTSFSAEADFEGILRQLRVYRVTWVVDVLANMVIPDKAAPEVRKRVTAIRNALVANTDAKKDFGNEIRVIVSMLDVLLDTLPRESEASATA